MSIFSQRPSVTAPFVAHARVSIEECENCRVTHSFVLEKDFNKTILIFIADIAADSCNSAKCGPQKRCVMRGGEPKCVCAPKCKSNQHHTKHHLTDDQTTTAHSHTDAQKSRRNINGNAHEREQRYRRRHASTAADVQITVLAGSGVQSKSSFNKNASMPKKDKVISIVSPSSQNSHRFRKNSLSIKSSSSSHNETQRIEHRDMRHGRKHRYNQHVVAGDQSTHRHHNQNASWEDRIRSGFYGHDIPYPPVDVPVVCASGIRSK